MPGIFSKSNRPLRPGSYFNWNALATATAPPQVGSIVAIPFTSDWGPFEEPTLVGSFSEYLAVFGPTVGTPGYNAVWGAFRGEAGFDGRFGAGAVLCYRMGGSAAAKATKALSNTTPATAITLRARYEGTFGNGLRVTTQDHAADSTKNELLLFNGTTLLETFIYTDTDIASLATQITAHSAWVTATSAITGVALAAVSSQAFTGGNDGTTVLAQDWTDMEAAMEREQFGVFSPYGLTDDSIITSMLAWAGGVESGSAGRNTKGQRFEVVLGGAASEDAADAIDRAQGLDDGNFVTLGINSFKDENLLDASGNVQTLSSSQFAPRVAGVLAGRGEAMSLTNARFPGVTLVGSIDDADVVACFNGGVLVITLDSDSEAPVHIEKGLTTFSKGAPGTTNADSRFPYVIYRNPKFMRTMQSIETEWTAWMNRNIIGTKPVNNKTRESALAELTRRCKAREGVGILQPGWTVTVDDDPPPSDSDEFIALKVGLLFGRSVEQVFFTVTAG